MRNKIGLAFPALVLSFALLLSSLAGVVPVRAASNIDPTTWVAEDGLGRTLPGNEDTGGPRQDKFVGVFYWTWHYNFANNEPRNVTQISKQYPDIMLDYNNPIWNNYLAGAYFWNEPIYGYYRSTDKYVLRKQVELLADAGVDVLFFDCTNGTFTWKPAYTALLEVMEEARADGINAPKIAFMMQFAATSESAEEIKSVYKDIYQKGKFQDSWFYWEGKPLMMAHPDNLSTINELEKEILEFFTFRKNDPSYFTETPATQESWGWLSVYPQTKYGVREDGSVEQMTVGIAQNASEHGLVAMNDYRGGVFGRSHTQQENYSYQYQYRGETILVNKDIANSMYYGLNFQEQWDYALSVDPNFVFVTGWNEWIAGRFETWQGSPNAFPDQYDDEHSRDIEPSKGELKDYYYYQLVANIRKFKGTNAAPVAEEPHTIDFNGDLSQWDAIASQDHYANNTYDRDTPGWKGTRYTNQTMRNDIVSTKVCYDQDNIYFYVKTAEDLTSPSDPAWMRLFLDTQAATKDSRDWEGFEYVINRQSPSDTVAYLEKSTGGWNWETVGEVSYKVQGSVLQLAVPRSMLGMTDSFVQLNYKWSDNMQTDGDVMDFYVNGDVAPGGRFAYSFLNREAADAIIRAKQNTILGLTPSQFIIVSVAIAAAAAVLIVAIVLGKKKGNRRSST